MLWSGWEGWGSGGGEQGPISVCWEPARAEVWSGRWDTCVKGEHCFRSNMFSRQAGGCWKWLPAEVGYFYYYYYFFNLCPESQPLFIVE